MSEQPNRWILKVVLILAVAALVGVSVIPLINAGFSSGFSSASDASPASDTTKAQPVSSSQQSEMESQIKGYDLVLQREPDNKIALKGLVDSRLDLIKLKLQSKQLTRDDVSAAIPSLERLAKVTPEDVRYGVLLAQYKQYVGDREGSAQAYRTILTSKPGELLALQGLVGLLLEQQRPEAAIGLLKDTLKLAPQANQTQPGTIDTTSVQLILGQVYELQSRYSDAISIYDEAIKAAPEDFRPIFGKAIVLSKQGSVTEAKALFDKAESLASPQYKDQIKQEATKALKAQQPSATSSPTAPTLDNQAPSPSLDTIPAPSTSKPVTVP